MIIEKEASTKIIKSIYNFNNQQFKTLKDDVNASTNNLSSSMSKSLSSIKQQADKKFDKIFQNESIVSTIQKNNQSIREIIKDAQDQKELKSGIVLSLEKTNQELIKILPKLNNQLMVQDPQQVEPVSQTLVDIDPQEYQRKQISRGDLKTSSVNRYVLTSSNSSAGDLRQNQKKNFLNRTSVGGFRTNKVMKQIQASNDISHIKDHNLHYPQKDQLHIFDLFQDKRPYESVNEKDVFSFDCHSELAHQPKSDTKNSMSPEIHRMADANSGIDLSDQYLQKIKTTSDIEKFLSKTFNPHPLSRMEVQNLKGQLNVLFEVNMRENMEQKDIYVKLQKEIIDQFYCLLKQQFGYECLQKSEMLALVWQQNQIYNNIFKDQIKELKKKFNRDLETENNQYLQIFSSNARNKDEYINQLEIDQNQLTQQKAHFDQEMSWLKLSNKRLIQDLEQYKYYCSAMQKKLADQQREIQRLALKPAQQNAIIQSQLETINNIALPTMNPNSLTNNQKIDQSRSRKNTNPTNKKNDITSLLIIPKDIGILQNEVFEDRQHAESLIMDVKQYQGEMLIEEKFTNQRDTIQLEITHKDRELHTDKSLDEGKKMKTEEDFNLDELQDEESNDKKQDLKKQNLNDLVFEMNMERVVNVRTISTQICEQFKNERFLNIETQTQISLLPAQFNVLFSNIENLKQAADSLDFQKQLNLVNLDNVERQIARMTSMQDMGSQTSFMNFPDTDSSDDLLTPGQPYVRNKTFQKSLFLQQKSQSDFNDNQEAMKLNIPQSFTHLEQQEKDIRNLGGFEDSNGSKQSNNQHLTSNPFVIQINDRRESQMSNLKDGEDLHDFINQELGINLNEPDVKDPFDKGQGNRGSIDFNNLLMAPNKSDKDQSQNSMIQISIIPTLNAIDAQSPQLIDKRLVIPGSSTKLRVDSGRPGRGSPQQKLNIEDVHKSKNDFLVMFKLYKTSIQKQQSLNQEVAEIKNKINIVGQERSKVEDENSQFRLENENLNAQISHLQEIISSHSCEMTLQQKQQNSSSLPTINTDNVSDSGMQARGSLIMNPRNSQINPRSRQVTRGPTLGKKVNVQYEFQKNQNAGKLIIEKIQSKQPVKLNNYMTAKTVIKYIYMIYNDRITQCKEKPELKELDMGSFTYNFFLSQFGLKNIADKKFLILVLSVKKHNSIFRISQFARFCNLFDNPTFCYTNDQLNKYIEVLDFVMNISQAGVNNFVYNDSDLKFMVPYIQVMHYLTTFGDARMSPQENREIKGEIEKIRETDPVTKMGIIDFDLFLNKLLYVFNLMVNRAQTYVINAFAACDLDGNQMCNLNEWLLLNRHIQPDKLSDEELVNIFTTSADLVEEGEQNFSFNQFAIICVEKELFTDEAQDKFLGIDNKQQTLESEYEKMRVLWEEKKYEILKRFMKMHPNVIEQQDIENWEQIWHILDHQIHQSLVPNQPYLIAYHIIDKESEILLDESIFEFEQDKDTKSVPTSISMNSQMPNGK